MKKLNSMCETCARLNKDCEGTTCQAWTGCVYREEDKQKRIFAFYKRDIIRLIRTNPRGIRFNCIQYVCRFPNIDPVEMAASLQNDGFTILFDDSSISAKENAAHRTAVNKAARRIQDAARECAR